MNTLDKQLSVFEMTAKRIAEPILEDAKVFPEENRDMVSTLSDNPWPDHPNEAAYHGLAGEFVRLVEPISEADPMVLLVQFLAGFGSVIG